MEIKEKFYKVRKLLKKKDNNFNIINPLFGYKVK